MPWVAFQPSGRRVEVPAGSRLLDAVVAAGLPIARACGAEGLCGRCGVRILAGDGNVDGPSEAEAATRRRNRLDPELRLACCARVHGDLEVTAPYW